ncbi:amidohydrolase [Halalkalibacter sp. APA_J-10(15)]|uniref:amidohydrolase n=1 Tax=Halalkalibacter sp. APA_J-10(15) TaxID=2933805 RepID=UPI001FF3A049|nr:amidohydrolase [Halalkalibacter sp. APA_J-10(15)]MCK0471316.1 amidohydrolase [Halalkalibacter sp. APA_J-10(15)]
MGTLWCNGTFYTMKEEGQAIEAVFVENGIVVALGSRRELERAFKDELEEVKDVNGGYVYPGFVDSHLHMIGHGETKIRLDLSNVTSAQEIKRLLKDKATTLHEGEWLLAEGWNENHFVDRNILHRDELDEICPDHPLYITRICRHAALVNSRALELAGIHLETNDPEGGVIVRDHKGEPTGYLLDAATELVKDVIPEVSEAYIRQALELAVDDLLSKGIVGGHTEDLAYYGGFEKTLSQFMNVIDGHRRKFRAHLLVHHEALDEMKQKQYSFGELTPFIELGAVKLFADGALGGRTALLKKPYSDDPSTSGVAIHSEHSLKKIVQLARECSQPVAIHTIGDGALEMALDVIEQYPLNQGRDRLIHVQVASESLIERMQALPVALDIQPRFVISDFPWVIERLGQNRMAYSFAWKTLLDAGLACAGGSDAPIEPIDPLLGIHAAVTRRNRGETHEGYLPHEKLSPFEAIQLFTKGSAYAIGKEHSRGFIAEGYSADFTVLDQDLFHIAPDEILSTTVLMTVVDNTVMYVHHEPS